MMKLALAAVATIAAAATTVSAWSTETCGFEVFVPLVPLLNDPNLPVCQDASGWTMLPPSGEPTPEQRAIMCQTTECFLLIEAVIATKPSDCILPIGENLNVLKLVTEFEPLCFNATFV